MGWPKGMPRKEHVNKDGSSHAKWGKKTARKPKFTVSHPAQTEFRVLGPTTSAGEEAARNALAAVRRRRGRPRKGEETGPRWTTKLSNKGFDPCPNCQFPEAYGGYCPECNWTEAIRYTNPGEYGLKGKGKQ